MNFKNNNCSKKRYLGLWGKLQRQDPLVIHKTISCWSKISTCNNRYWKHKFCFAFYSTGICSAWRNINRFLTNVGATDIIYHYGKLLGCLITKKRWWCGVTCFQVDSKQLQLLIVREKQHVSLSVIFKSAQQEQLGR